LIFFLVCYRGISYICCWNNVSSYCSYETTNGLSNKNK